MNKNAKKGKIIIFSGAGISAESGLATFRDSNGLWANYDIDVVCNYHSWRQNYELVHKFYNLRREELSRVKPNIAHKITQQLTQKFEVINITQNVDDLFERAYLEICGDFMLLDSLALESLQGDLDKKLAYFLQYNDANILHLHGKLWEIRCEECESIFTIGYAPYDFSPCQKCGNAKLKPNIVFFYEQAPKYAEMYEIFSQINDDDIIVVSGTSGEVVNICAMINKGYKILNNLEKTRGINENLFDSVYLESSISAFPKIYDEICKLKNA